MSRRDRIVGIIYAVLAIAWCVFLVSVIVWMFRSGVIPL